MEYPVRIQWEDIDYAAVIFWPRYFVYFDQAISEWLLSKGLPWVELLAKRKIAFPIVSVAADFYKPVRLQDDTILELGLCDLVPQGCSFVFNVKRRSEGDSELLASGYIQRRFVDRELFVPCKLPTDLMAILPKCRRRAGTSSACFAPTASLR